MFIQNKSAYTRDGRLAERQGSQRIRFEPKFLSPADIDTSPEELILELIDLKSDHNVMKVLNSMTKCLLLINSENTVCSVGCKSAVDNDRRNNMSRYRVIESMDRSSSETDLLPWHANSFQLQLSHRLLGVILLIKSIRHPSEESITDHSTSWRLKSVRRSKDVAGLNLSPRRCRTHTQWLSLDI
ncbi:hypothetical protein TNCV_4517111 [Trichonephila clavipes]|nr:hypothetical protein TNCV_4517111 [Trichonephila clavipes]